MLRTFLTSLKARPVVALLPQRLAEVSAGTRVRICGFIDMPGVETLRERGLCEEAEVRILKAGDPLVCLVWGSRLMLNRKIAEGILVEVVA